MGDIDKAPAPETHTIGSAVYAHTLRKAASREDEMGNSDFAEALREVMRIFETLGDGWKLVPVEPSRMMDYAGHDAFVDASSSRYEGSDPHRDVWQAMLAASPAPETREKGKE